MNNFERIKNSKPLNAPDFVMPKSRQENPKKTEAKPIPPPTVPQKRNNGILGLLDFKNMAMDSDRSVILMMLALLSGKAEETDDLLIMALLYIML